MTVIDETYQIIRNEVHYNLKAPENISNICSKVRANDMWRKCYEEQKFSREFMIELQRLKAILKRNYDFKGMNSKTRYCCYKNGSTGKQITKTQTVMGNDCNPHEDVRQSKPRVFYATKRWDKGFSDLKNTQEDPISHQRQTKERRCLTTEHRNVWKRSFPGQTVHWLFETQR